MQGFLKSKTVVNVNIKTIKNVKNEEKEKERRKNINRKLSLF